LQEHSTGYLDSLFDERVTDVGTRRKLRQARSFCNWHAWHASQMTSAALGVAIIAHDLLDEELNRLTTLRPSSFSNLIGLRSGDRIPRRPLLAYLRGWRQRSMCPVCQVLIVHERYALETTLDCLHEAEFASRFRASTGLCLPHTGRALGLYPWHATLGRLIEIQREKYAQLMAELDEFSRKHDYRFARQQWGSESDSWSRAIEMLAGKPGIYGSDMPRSSSEPGPCWGQMRRLLSGVQRLARTLVSLRPNKLRAVAYGLWSFLLLGARTMIA
jgi:hypothetical protein